MVLYFDLSIPYLESDVADAPENKARRAARLKAVVKAMELGYTAVAYDRPFRGVMSDADRCKIPPFPLSSLFGVAPAIVSGIAFHRDLLGVPHSAPFRQYSRLTVSIGGKSSTAAAALHPGNPILRTYDIAAVRPLNQEAFDEACKFSEVDIISMDFSQKLPFRLRLPMVEVAVKRGLHFEITYSHLIADVHVRRQMLSHAKLLVDWTKGKNLIISSAASTANEIRGPYDIANLSAFLLGLSIERAKAAISENCRLLVANALRKKHCYKESIRIERIFPDQQLDSKKIWFGDCNDWDPTSSGQGDLPSLDDIAKFFSSASKLSTSSNAIDFTSISDGMSFSFSQHETKISSPKKLGLASSADGTAFVTTDDVALQEKSNEFLDENRMPMDTTPLEQQKPVESVLVSSVDMETSLANAEGPDPDVVVNEDPKSFSGHAVVSDARDVSLCNAMLEDCKFTDEENLLSSNANQACSTLFEGTEPSNKCLKDNPSPDQSDNVPVAIEVLADVSEEMYCINVARDQIPSKDNESFFTIFMEKDIPKEQMTKRNDGQELKDENMNADGISLQRGIAKTPESDQREGVSPLADDIPLEDAIMDTGDKDVGEILIQREEVLKEFASNKNEQIAADGGIPCKSKSVKCGSKQRLVYPALPLPFKGVIKPMLFKKRKWQIRRPRKHLQG